jgi:hypothetical protein
MSSSSRVRNSNQLAISGRTASALTDVRQSLVLHMLYRKKCLQDSDLASLLGLPGDALRAAVERLLAAGLILQTKDGYELAEDVKQRLAYKALSLEFLIGRTLTPTDDVPHRLGHPYLVETLIGKGSTSATFLARQLVTQQQRTLKVFLPGAAAYAEVEGAIRAFVRAVGDSVTAFPEIIEAGEIAVTFPNGGVRILTCVVLQHVDSTAQTFIEFLKEYRNLDASMFDRFVDRIAGGLELLERTGLRHGDLHEGNILVTPGRDRGGSVDFWIIDFIGVPPSTSPDIEPLSDLEAFREHLVRAVIAAVEKYPGYSARLLLGARVYRVLGGLRSGVYANFAQLLTDYRAPKKVVPEHYFQEPPQPFDWLRVEWIPSPDWLLKLFHPVQSRYETISRFGNTWISGPRGCGKSHYLRVLAFQPSLYLTDDPSLQIKMKALGCDFRKAFGVLFACRLGEFKAFDPEALSATEFDVDTRQFVKHILILKIINKTLFSLREGLESQDDRPILEAPSSLDGILTFFTERFGSLALIEPAEVITTFRQSLAMSVARENDDIAVWNQPERRSAERLVEKDLDTFFAILRQTFPDLVKTRFYILVDDATSGHVHFETQKLLNSLVRAQQANHCFKITFERFMYTLDSADGRAIDPRHEVTYVDLGEISVKAQKDTGFDYSSYMAEVVNLRLKAQSWMSDIRTILGDSQPPQEFLGALSGIVWNKGQPPLVNTLPKERAFYAGWNIICSIAHGSVRTLLEVVESVFRAVNANQATESISLKEQDAVVRAYSRRQFRVLTLLPGEIDGEPIGQQLQAVIAAIGELSGEYLRRYNTNDSLRWYETISIERLDHTPLDDRAQRILGEMVKYGLILKEGVTFTRADIGLGVRYDLNKIFSPAFEITYRVRNHLYLGHGRFQELLLSPDVFVRKHRQKFDLMGRENLDAQQQLFD